MEAVAFLAVGLLLTIAIFQISLAFGAPWRATAWGCQHSGVLPWTYRIDSLVVALFFYPVVALTLLNHAGLMGDQPALGPRGLWVIAALFAIGSLVNFISRSKPERMWGPVSLIIAVCVVIWLLTPHDRAHGIRVHETPKWRRDYQAQRPEGDGLTGRKGKEILESNRIP